MLVSLKRDFFGPGGVLYKKGTVEYNGAEESLPSDAVIVSENGRLPVRSNTPKPGFGAKPLEEQVLDLISGAGVSHQIDVTPGKDAPRLTEAERKEQDEKAAKAEEAAAAERKKQTEKEDAELKADVAEGLKNAEKAAEAVTKATDPIQGLFTDDEKPKPKK